MFPAFFMYGDWALAFVRIVLGFLLFMHGWPKLKDLKTTAANFGAMGFKPGGFWGPLVATVEFFGGLAFILGIWVQGVAALVAIQFLVITIWKIIGLKPFVGGYEYDLLILALSFLLLTQGAGAFSLDHSLYGTWL